MKDINDYKKTGMELFDLLRLNSYPVAVKYFKDKKEIPAGFMRPSAFGQKWSLCQAITQARRSGSRLAMTADDNFCVPASFAQGWLPLEFADLVESQRLNQWRDSNESEVNVQAQFGAEILQHEGYKKVKGNIGFLLAPIKDAPYLPDSILLYGSPAQMLHVIHALAYEGKHVVKSTFIGFAESCFKGAFVPYVTGKPQYVSPGMGDIDFSGTGEHEVAVGIPGELLFYVKEKLFKTGGPFNIGLPSKIILAGHLTERILPGWSYLQDKLDGMKK